MTSKKVILFYSLSGNTKNIALSFIEDADIFQIKKGLIIPINNNKDFNWSEYDVIFFGTSTLGRGDIPKDIKPLFPLLKEIQGKKIVLFGSGNSIYPQFCGALDLLNKAFSNRNKVLEIFKFEEAPQEENFNDLRSIFNKY